LFSSVISIFFCAPVCGFAMLSYDGSKAWVHPSVSLLRGASLSTSGPNLPSAPSMRVDAYDTRDESNERNLLDFIHPTSSRAPHAFAHPTSVLRSRPDDQAPQGFLDSAERLPKANSRRRRRRRRLSVFIGAADRRRRAINDHCVFVFRRASRRRRSHSTYLHGEPCNVLRGRCDAARARSSRSGHTRLFYTRTMRVVDFVF